MDGQKSTDMCNESSKLSPDSAGSSVLSSFSGNSDNSDSKVQHLTLQSPGGGDQLTFVYSIPNTEFVDILKFALEEFEGLQQVVEKTISVSLDSLYSADYGVLSKVCKAFNKAAHATSSLWKGSTRPGENSDLASSKFLQRIITHCYNKAIDNEKALNKHYEPFSSCTYGETSFERMQTIIDELKPSPQDVFVDLGSGVGQLVVHMAGVSKVKKAFGIEIAKLPAKFAALLEEEFRKLMRFYGKKVRQFSLELGNFLDAKYRELITKEATIIFINNYAFTPELEARIKHELLLELQSGTRIVSTKPYASINKLTVNAREVNDFSSIADIREMKRCPNPCSWTSNDVKYFLHTVDHGKIEKYVSNLRPGALRAIDGRRSLTPSSSKNSNSRESSVSFREANKSKRVFGPTTRRTWKAYVSEKKEVSVEDEPESSQVYQSESDSEPIKKRKRSKKTIKPKTPKNVDKQLSMTEDDVDLSEDAKDGIELMHQMTQAVSAGQSADSTKTAMLTDLSNNEKQVEKVEKPKTIVPSSSKKRSSFKQTDMMFPLTDAILPNKRKKRVLESNDLDNNLEANKSKYEHLDVFLSELKRTYELFLDNIYAVPNSAIKIEKPTVGPSSIDITKIALPIETNGPVLNSNLDNVLQMFDRINQKYVDLGQDIGNLRKAIVDLNSNNPVQVNTVQQNHVQPVPSGIPNTNLHPTVNNLTNGNQLQQIVDTTNNCINLMTNGSTQNGVAYDYSMINTVLSNFLATQCSSSAKSLINQVTPISLQNSTAQHISPQTSNSYSNQLNGLNAMSNGLNSANLIGQKATINSYIEIEKNLRSLLFSNEYTAAQKNEILNTAIQQNPICSSILQTIFNDSTVINQLQHIFNNSTVLNQLQQSNSTVNLASPVNAPVSVASNQPPEISPANQVIAAQTLYNSQMQIKPENGTENSNLGVQNQQYLNELNGNEPQSQSKIKNGKKTERKPRSKRSKEVESIVYPINENLQTGNEASSSRIYMNNFNMNHTPIGVEKILSHQLSIQSQLPLPKEQASFHSPNF